ncbi:RNA polymerase sigma-70 factor (sigma-E family) [Nocardioides sp. BE266]|uniref:SigE family RNA polymerase sigma factor n=1 Tax=Nocardioides sp. BE266 TaxID=2817725 RepID=UPI002859D1BB|nr:SigE family RNA polymerase sigma factor [Nocardioides sp. BE266]MDR7254468.1 RNA polymerase sigma-70 factor (sigma-E family) [Nocardioides sp. BE266]
MTRRDPAAFAEFVAARSASLHRTAYLLVGDRGLAQDLLQEALTKTYVAWPRLRDPGSAEAYTRKALTTTAITWYRRRSWGERPIDTVPDHAADGLADDVATRDLLWQALQSLPPRQRAAIVLRYYEDLTEAQTADVMGCAVGTVKSQVSAGLRSLRTRLGDRATDSDLVPLDLLEVTR